MTGVAEIFLELVLVMMSSFPREKALEEALETILAIDEKWGIVNRNRIEKFLARAVQHPGTGNYVPPVAKPCHVNVYLNCIVHSGQSR